MAGGDVTSSDVTSGDVAEGGSVVTSGGVKRRAAMRRAAFCARWFDLPPTVRVRRVTACARTPTVR